MLQESVLPSKQLSCLLEWSEAVILELWNLAEHAASRGELQEESGKFWWWLFLLTCSVVYDSLWLHGLQLTRLLWPSLSPGVYSNSCPLSQWCHPTISSSVIPFIIPLSPPALNLFQHPGIFQLVSCSNQVAKVLEFQLQHHSFQWFPLGSTGWISLLSKGLSRVFSNTTVQNINSLVLSCLYGPSLISIHDYWKNHSF